MLRPTIIVIAVLGLSAWATAEGPGIAPKRLAVDVVSIKGGPQLLGMIVQQAPDGPLLFAVERDWLKTNHRRYYAEVSAGEAALEEAADDGLQNRIREWIKRRAPDRNLVLFLEGELQRLEMERAARVAEDPKKVKPVEEKQFVLVEIPGDQVRSLYRQPPERRQLAMLAWRQRLKNVTTRTANNLLKELNDLGVEIGVEPVSLADRFPGQLLDEQQWAARVALVEYRLKQKLSFQGEGSFIARTGEGAAEIDLADLIQKIIEQQLESQRAVAEGRTAEETSDWIKKPIEEAEYAHLNGFLVSRLKRQFVFTGDGFEFPKEATVELAFFARQPDGLWQEIWSISKTQEAAVARPETKAEVSAAPEIKKVLDLLKLAGLAKDGSMVERAIGFGAAAKQAQVAAEQHFNEFLLLHTRHVDTPPIPLPPPVARPS